MNFTRATFSQSCCLDVGTLHQLPPVSLHSSTGRCLRSPFLNNRLNWQLLEVGEEHSATDGWLASNGSVSVRQLSFPLQITPTESGGKKSSSWTEGRQELLHHSRGNGWKLTATWVCSHQSHFSSYKSPYYKPHASLWAAITDYLESSLKSKPRQVR